MTGAVLKRCPAWQTEVAQRARRGFAFKELELTLARGDLK